jgi:hypothetical protein
MKQNNCVSITRIIWFKAKMQAVCSSETLVSSYKLTSRYNPEDQHRHISDDIQLLL